MCIALTCANNTQRLTTFPWVLQVLQIAGSSNSTGSLPISWSAPGSFLSLKVLNLAGASFTGSIPSSWVTQGAFPKMTYLSLANTTLTGAVPSFHTGQLAVLDLSFSGLTGNISDLWKSTSSTISAIGLTGVNVTGGFPYELPLFWKSLRSLVVDNTSITGTIPTSWLATASVERSPYSKSWTVNSQMQNLSFSGGQLWDRSLQDPSWWPGVCSSFSKLAGYGSIYNNPRVRYSGIEAVVRPMLDVTHKLQSYSSRTDDVPRLPFPDTGYVDYFSQDTKSYYTSFLDRYVDNFQLENSLQRLPSPIGQCPAAPWATPVIAAWAAFGAASLVLATGFVMWLLLVQWHPAVISWRPTTSFACKLCCLCGHFLTLLSLGLYLYNLITDVMVVVAVWDVRFWWAKDVLAFVLVQYVLRAFIVTIHLCRAETISTEAHVLIFLSMPFIAVFMPIADVLCSLSNVLHHPLFEAMSHHRYQHLRILAVSVLQALPNAALVTVIYHQGTVPFSLDHRFSLLGALEHNTDPHFLSRSLFLQAVVSSLASVVLGIAVWFFLSHKHNTGLFKTLWIVISCPASTPAAAKEEATQLPVRRATTYCMVHFPGIHLLVLVAAGMNALFASGMQVLTSTGNLNPNHVAQYHFPTVMIMPPSEVSKGLFESCIARLYK